MQEWYNRERVDYFREKLDDVLYGVGYAIVGAKIRFNDVFERSVDGLRRIMFAEPRGTPVNVVGVRGRVYVEYHSNLGSIDSFVED